MMPAASGFVRQRLYTPGPVNVDPQVSHASTIDINHRSQTFQHVLRDTARQVSDLYPQAGDTVLMPGSATYGLEASIAGFCPVGSRVLAISNGIYGDRLIAIAEQSGIEVDVVRSPLGAQIDIDGLAKRASGGGYTAILAVHHETSTGTLNDLAAISGVARDHGIRLILDAVSSLGCEDLSSLSDAQWVAIGSSNKAIESVPGLALITADSRSWREVLPTRSFSLDLRKHHQSQTRGEVVFTPPVGAVLALQQALVLLHRETVGSRRSRYDQELELYRDELVTLGFTEVVPAAINSSSILLLRLPARTSSARLRGAMLERGLVIYHGVTEAADDQIRLSSMGWHDDDHVQVLVNAIRDFLR